MTRNQRSGLIVLSILVAALAMGLWIRNFGVSSEELSHIFNRMSWALSLPLFGLIVVHVALSSWRWTLIEEGLGGVKPCYVHAFATGAIAQGLGTFLPSPLVNVACRGIANKVSGASGLRGALSGGVDQLADFAIVLLVVVPAAAALLYHDFAIYLLGAPVMLLLGLALIMGLPAITSTVRLPFRLPSMEAIGRKLDRRLLVKIFGISVLRVTNLTLMNLLILAATDVANTQAVVIGVPLVALTTSIAMLPGAIGVSEWSFSAVFAGFNIARSDIVLFVLANRILLTCVSLILMLIVLVAIAAMNVRRSSGR